MQSLPNLKPAWLTALAWLALAAPMSAQITLDGQPAETKADDPCFELLTTAGNRTVDCGNGTVYDPVTRLLWLKDARCNRLVPLNGGLTQWREAMEAAASLSDGFDCDGDGSPDLSDRSQPGDWRLATIDEWEAMINRARVLDIQCFTGGFGGPPSIVDDTGDACYGNGSSSSFERVVTSRYWSSTSVEATPDEAYIADFETGSTTGTLDKDTFSSFVWPVRELGSPDQVGLVKDRGAVVETAPSTRSALVAALMTSAAGDRFLDLADGTIFDTVTNLLLLKHHSCSGILEGGAASATWPDALEAAASTAHGVDCDNDGNADLSDQSQKGDWRLMTSDEWSLLLAQGVALGCLDDMNPLLDADPTLPNDTGDDCLVQGPSAFLGPYSSSDCYWSSDTRDRNLAVSFAASLDDGTVGQFFRTSFCHVWPVREVRP